MLRYSEKKESDMRCLCNIATVLLCWIVCSTAGSSSSHAEEAPGTPAPRGSNTSPSRDTPGSAIFDRVYAYLRQPAVFQAEQGVLKTSASRLPDACPTMTLRPTGLTVVVPPQFDPSGALQSGTFREAWTGQGCGDSHPILNLWTIAAPGVPPKIFTSYPGDSIADPQLQRDAFLVAHGGAFKQGVPSCERMDVVNTHFTGFEGAPKPTVNGRMAAPWKEDWLLMGCGHAVKVVVHFVPDLMGTTEQIRSSETVLLK
jgi:hypothetical protein